MIIRQGKVLRLWLFTFVSTLAVPMCKEHTKICSSFRGKTNEYQAIDIHGIDATVEQEGYEQVLFDRIVVFIEC